MSTIALRDLRARRAHHVGHRTLAEGEVLCRIQFRSDDDAKFFGNHLRWSAFEIVTVEDPATPKPASATPVKPDAPTPAPKSTPKPASRLKSDLDDSPDR